MMTDRPTPSLPVELWLANAIDVVAEFADRERQNAAWQPGVSGTQFDSADEMMCRLFDDVKIDAFLEECSGALGDECIKSGQRLVRLLDAYQWPMAGNFINDERLLHEPAWGEVRDAASRFLDCLKATKQKIET